MHVYIMSVEALERETLFAGAFQKVDAVRQEKVKKAVRQADRRRCLGAGLLFQYAVSCYEEGREEQVVFRKAEFSTVYEAVRQPRQFQYRYGQDGKPYLEGEKKPFYSLSHSGNYVLCAIGDREVGADIQVYREEKNYRLAKRYFTGEEAGRMEQAAKEEQKELFYRFWTAKEAYVKLTGKGLKQGLNSFRADLEKGRILEPCASGNSGRKAAGNSFSKTANADVWEERAGYGSLLAEYRELPGYAVSVCFYGEFT